MSTEGTGPDAAPFRDQAPQYALPLLIRVERAAPPQRAAALEAAALPGITVSHRSAELRVFPPVPVDD